MDDIKKVFIGIVSFLIISGISAGAKAIYDTRDLKQALEMEKQLRVQEMKYLKEGQERLFKGFNKLREYLIKRK